LTARKPSHQNPRAMGRGPGPEGWWKKIGSTKDRSGKVKEPTASHAPVSGKALEAKPVKQGQPQQPSKAQPRLLMTRVGCFLCHLAASLGLAAAVFWIRAAALGHQRGKASGVQNALAAGRPQRARGFLPALDRQPGGPTRGILKAAQVMCPHRTACPFESLVPVAAEPLRLTGMP
jgi:hypothetical protein